MEAHSKTVVILHNIRSIHNVGSIFRTCDAAGVSLLYLCGITPTPIDRFGRKRQPLSKVALGAEESILWEAKDDVLELVAELKEKGFFIVSVEQAQNSQPLETISKHKKTAFIFGSETEGIPQDILDISNAICEIPMKGVKESLNVSVSVGVTLYSNL